MKKDKINIEDKNLLRNIENEYKKCIGCKLCTKGCPMLDIFSNNPKNLLKELNHLKKFDIKLPYSCMLCGYCREVCPVDNSFRDIFYKLRQITVDKNGGRVPIKLNTMSVDLHQSLSFSKFFSNDIKDENEIIFFPGCSLISYDPKLVKKIYLHLNSKTNMGFCNKCCGKPTDFLGKKDKFFGYISELEDDLKRKNIKKIITGCQSCYMNFTNNISGIEIVSIYEELDKLGLPKFSENKFSKSNLKFTVHDPCPTRSKSGIHKAIRNLINQMGIKINEKKYTKNFTLCCGMGAMISKTAPKISEAHRLRLAGETNDEMIISYCGECISAMRSPNKEAIHILDLIFMDNYKDCLTRNNNLIESWMNRLKMKKIMGEIEDE